MGRRSTFYFRSEHLSVSVGPPRPRVVPPARCREDVRAPVVVAGTAVSLELAGEAKLSPSRPTLPRHQNRRAEVPAPGRGCLGQPSKQETAREEGSGKQFVLPWVFSVSTAGSDITSLAQQLQGLGGEAWVWLINRCVTLGNSLPSLGLGCLFCSIRDCD